MQCFCLRITLDKAWYFQTDGFTIWSAYLLAHGVKVNFLCSAMIQSKASHFTDCLSVLGLIGIVFWPP